jgi:arylsulfatase A-like enzyme
MPEEFHAVPVSSAQPLRAGKGTIYEAGTRVPLLVVWPGRVSPGSVSHALVQSTDFFPTLADMLGWTLPASVRFDGVSQRPAFEKNQHVREEIFCHFPHGNAAKDYEGMTAPTSASPASSVRSGDWKLIRFFCDNADQTDRHELFNLAEDPGESRDVAAAHPDRVKQLAAQLDTLLHGTSAVIPSPNPAYSAGAAKRSKPAAASKQP